MPSMKRKDRYHLIDQYVEGVLMKVKALRCQGVSAWMLI
jgi:hypothetical protein